MTVFSSLIVAVSSWKKYQIKLQRHSGSSCRDKDIVCAIFEDDICLVF